MQAERPRVLMVDEDEAVARALSFVLEREGFEVRQAAGEEAALAAATRFVPDIVLLEVRPRRGIGLRVLARLRQCDALRQAAVILVTSRSEPRDIVAGLDRGADDYILKPFDPREVVARLRAQLRIRRLQDQLIAAERWRVLLETAGGVAHELSQPLTAMLGNLERLLRRMESGDPNRRAVQRIAEHGERAAGLLRRLQRIEAYELKDYAGSEKILDLERSSRK